MKIEITKEVKVCALLSGMLREALEGKQTADVIIMDLASRIDKMYDGERFEKMENALKGVMNLKQLIEYPKDVKPEHFDEGRAISTMLTQVNEALTKS